MIRTELEREWKQTINVEPQQDRWPSPTMDEIFWVRGNYKIAYYHRHPDNYGNPMYGAYFKPYGWVNWGEHVDRGTPMYLTLEAAQQACEKHREG